MRPVQARRSVGYRPCLRRLTVMSVAFKLQRDTRFHFHSYLIEDLEWQQRRESENLQSRLAQRGLSLLAPLENIAVQQLMETRTDARFVRRKARAGM